MTACGSGFAARKHKLGKEYIKKYFLTLSGRRKKVLQIV
jgi:hypothetical protein